MLLASPGLSSAATPTQLCEARTAASLDALTHGDFDVAGKDFDPDLARTRGVAQLRLQWANVQRLAGSFRTRNAPAWQTVDGRRYLFTTMNFAGRPLNAIDACDGDGRTSVYEWTAASDAAAKIAYARPHVDSDGVRELPVVVMSAWGPLPATLAMPSGEGPFPAVSLVAGARPNDQDESIGPNKPFRDLAHGLANVGVASLRYDKSIAAYPSQAGLSTPLTVDDEVTNDGFFGLKTLRAQKRIDPARIFLLGHSLGAMMAPPAESILANGIQQTRYVGGVQHMPEAALQQQLQSLSDELALLALSASGHPPAGSFMEMPQSWWMSLHVDDQVAVAKSLTQPMLILQGAADFQVPPSYNLIRWQRTFAHDPRVRLIEYPGVSHIFMPAGAQPSPADYARPAHGDAQVIHDMAARIIAQAAGS